MKIFSLAKIFLLFIAAFPSLASAQKLPELHADPTRTSVSGLSSGAFMAVQYDVAFSASTLGVGVVAGGPYNCAAVTVGGFLSCMQGITFGYASYEAAIGFAALGQIDPLENLTKDKVYLFSGTEDTVVKQQAMDSVRDFYTLIGVPAANLVYVNKVAAGHAFISPSFGGQCAVSAAPYVNQCTVDNVAYDQPAAILTQIYGPLQPKVPAAATQPTAFDQTEFGSILAGMAKTGYLYVPASCQQSSGKNCAVHVVFHGCLQGSGEVGDDVYRKVGYNEWAEANGIIVLYPQVDPTTEPSNPQGCWDWFGYDGLDFQVKTGKQMAAVHAMVARLTRR